MPEYPDVTVYIERLRAKLAGTVLNGVKLASPFVLRTFDPPLEAVHGKRVEGFHNLGKRLVFELEDDLFLVIHLMIAGRLRWSGRKNAKPAGRVGLAAFHFDHGTLQFTEASKKKRASIHVVRGTDALAPFDRGGLDVFGLDLAGFADRLVLENHTIKRTLTDPRMFSGIGNAYSDEILHQAQISPVKWTTRLTEDEVARLFAATTAVLTRFTEAIRAEVGDGFPDKVTAFRDDMAVHGRYKQPCPVCGSKVQRIVHGEHETNYCATCQTGGKLLADRALSQLLKKDWPKTLDEMEAKLRGE